MNTNPYRTYRLRKKLIYLLFFSVCVSENILSQGKLIIHPIFQEYKSDARDIIPFKKLKQPKIAVVLSGGGARGIAQIGVLKILEKYNIPIHYIIGTSMGSIIGGLYSSGYSTSQLETLMDTTAWNYILSFTEETDRKNLFIEQKFTADKNQLTIRFDGLSPIIPSSLSSGQRLTNFLNQLTLQGIYHPISSFDDFKIPFRAVATDLISGKKIVFNSGNLSEALRASAGIPLLFSTMKKDTMELTDGGITSNIPVDVAQELHADIIIAVNVTSPLRTSANELSNPWEIVDQVSTIMSQATNKKSLEQAAIVITPALGSRNSTDFSHLHSLVVEGEKATEQIINALQDTIENRQREDFRYGPDISALSFKIKSIQFSDSAGIPETFKKEFVSFLSMKQTAYSEIKEKVSLLFSTGYFKDVFAEVNIVDTLTMLRIITQTNPVLRSVSVIGNAVIPTQEILAEFDSLQNTIITPHRSKKAIENILSLYREHGYSLARIQHTQFDTATGHLAIVIDEGTIYDTHIEGNKHTRDWVVRRELLFSGGDIFTVMKAQQAIANIASTNLFEQVLIDVRYENNLPVIVAQVTEKKSELIRLGTFINSERNFQASVDLRDENLLGTATDVGLNFAGGFRNRKYIAEIKANRIFNSFFNFNINAYYNFRDTYTYSNDPAIKKNNQFKRIRIGEFRQTYYGTAFSLGRQVEKLGLVSAEYRLEANQIDSLSGIGYALENFNVQALKLHSIIDSQDRFPFPRSGSLMKISWETASSSLVGDVGYSKIFLSYEWFNTYFSAHTFHPKIIFGFADQTLPLSQQFTLGGENSFYGLLEDDSRGRQIFAASFEYRVHFPFKLIWDTYFKARYDFGNIWPQQSDISVRDFHHGIGVGFALDTPIGPASISVGRSFYIRRDLLNEPLSLGSIVGYFSIGYAF